MAKRTTSQQVFDALRGHYDIRDRIARKPVTTLRMALDPFLNGETSLPQFLTRCGLPEEQSALEQVPISSDLLGRFGGEVSPLGVRFVLGPESIRRMSGSLGRLEIAFARRQLRLAHIVAERLMFVRVGTPAYAVARSIGPEIEEIELALRSSDVVRDAVPRIVGMHHGQRLTWAKESPANRPGILDGDCPEAPVDFAQRQLELARLVITLITVLRSENNQLECLRALRSELSDLSRSINQVSETSPNRLTPLLRVFDDVGRALGPLTVSSR